MSAKSDRRLLAELFPKCFAPKGRGYRKKPLKHSIEDDIFIRGVVDAQGTTLSMARIRAALREYLFGSKYVHALARGGRRFDLDGNAVGWVSKECQANAQAKIAASGWQNHDSVREAA